MNGLHLHLYMHEMYSRMIIYLDGEMLKVVVVEIKNL